MIIDDLAKSLKDMSDEELHAQLLEIKNRRVQPPELAARAEKKKTVKKEEALVKSLQGLNPEALKQLLSRYVK